MSELCVSLCRTAPQANKSTNRTAITSTYNKREDYTDRQVPVMDLF